MAFFFLSAELEYASTMSSIHVHLLRISLSHYANTPMQYSAIFHGCKNVHFQMKFFYILFFAQNIDCGFTLEPPH